MSQPPRDSDDPARAWTDIVGYEPMHQATPQYVLDAIGSWADPESVDKATLQTRMTYENGGQITFGRDGLPRNPSGPTGKTGRLLGKWGPNHAADPIVFRKNPTTDGLEMLAILRKDTQQWAIPGGMCDAGEAIAETLARELKEETNVTLDMTNARVVYQGINETDPRNTDNAWMETNVTLTVLDAATAHALEPIEAGDDAQRVQWMPLTEANIARLYSSHGRFVRQALALHNAEIE